MRPSISFRSPTCPPATSTRPAATLLIRPGGLRRLRHCPGVPTRRWPSARPGRASPNSSMACRRWMPIPRKPESGSTRCATSSIAAAASGRPTCSMPSSRRLTGWGFRFRFRLPPPTSTRFRSIVSLCSPAIGRSSGGSRASFAGMRWPWWSAPIGKTRALAATSRPLPLRPRSWTWR